MELTTDLNSDGRPRIVQGTQGLVFRCGGEGELRCRACGHLLAEGNVRRRLLAFDIQCFACKSLTRTPHWPDGEPLPVRLLTLGGIGAFLVNSVIDLSKGDAAVSCDQEIARVESVSNIRPTRSQTLELTEHGLEMIATRLDILSEGAFGKALASTLRALRAGNDLFLTYPAAWALARLQACASRSEFHSDGADGVAITYLNMLTHVIDRWEHHPRFRMFSKELVHQFHHVLFQLIAASYLADRGNDIGFTDPAAASGRSPDLFINIGTSTRVSIEIKTPTDLQWPCVTPTASRLQAILLKHCRTARGQILPEEGGVVVVGASISDPFIDKAIEEAATVLFTNNRISSRIAGLIGVSMSPHFSFRQSAGLRYETTGTAQFVVVRNPKYVGPDILRTE